MTAYRITGKHSRSQSLDGWASNPLLIMASGIAVLVLGVGFFSIVGFAALRGLGMPVDIESSLWAGVMVSIATIAIGLFAYMVGAIFLSIVHQLQRKTARHDGVKPDDC